MNKRKFSLLKNDYTMTAYKLAPNQADTSLAMHDTKLWQEEQGAAKLGHNMSSNGGGGGSTVNVIA